jgi:hypothetical protein
MENNRSTSWSGSKRRRLYLQIYGTILAGIVLYVTSAAIVFNFSRPALDRFQEWRGDMMVAYGPRPRPFLGLIPTPIDETYWTGKEWPFILYAPICSIWRRHNGYTLPDPSLSQ